jgi:hypothetical protein
MLFRLQPIQEIADVNRRLHFSVLMQNSRDNSAKDLIQIWIHQIILPVSIQIKMRSDCSHVGKLFKWNGLSQFVIMITAIANYDHQMTYLLLISAAL